MTTKPGVLRLLTLVAVGAFCAVALSCTTTSAGGNSIPKPTRLMANNAGPNVRLDTLNRGYEVFLRSCSECHGSVPKAPTDRLWHSESMGNKLYESLSASDRYAVLEYIRGVENRWFKIDHS